MIQLPFSPMLAEKVTSPGSGRVERFPLLERPGMAWECKWDGYRMAVSIEGGRTTVWMARSMRDVTSDWPEIVSMFSGLTGEYVFDGELLVLDADGRPTFEALSLAGRLSGPQRAARARFAAFDLLVDRGQDIQRQPYVDRRKALTDVLVSGSLPASVLLTPAENNGIAMWNAIVTSHMEGVIGKPLASRYLQGERGTWVKLKALRQAEYLIIGYTSGEGSRTGLFGAVILGSQGPDGQIHYAGKCGTGWNEDSAAALLALLRPLETTEPSITKGELLRVRSRIGPRTVTWVRPGVSGVVEFNDTGSDNTPRFPAWKKVVTTW